MFGFPSLQNFFSPFVWLSSSHYISFLSGMVMNREIVNIRKCKLTSLFARVHIDIDIFQMNVVYLASFISHAV